MQTKKKKNGPAAGTWKSATHREQGKNPRGGGKGKKKVPSEVEGFPTPIKMDGNNEEK